MRSIRRHLTLWLVGGLGILWVAAGAGVFFAVREGLQKSVDAQLALDARMVRFASKGNSDEDRRSRGARRLEGRMPGYDDPEGDSFYQQWTPSGSTIEKSNSLG